MKIKLPFRNPKDYPMTQRFGEKFIYGGKVCEHKGVDWAMPKLTQLMSPFDGFIKRITPDRTVGYGKAVYIEADDRSDGICEVLLAHCESIGVEKGMRVKTGNNIALSGRSGFWRGVNGYHLHFGISIMGKYVDPLPLLKIGYEQEENLFNQDDDSIKTFLGKYVVQKGDSLWQISKKYYGNGGHYMEIFRVNQDIITSPNLIYPEQVLKIPALKNRGV